MANQKSSAKNKGPKAQQEEVQGQGAPAPEETPAAPTGLRAGAKSTQDAPAAEQHEGQENHEESVDPATAEAKKQAEAVKATALTVMVGEKTPEAIAKTLHRGIDTTLRIARGVNRNEAISDNFGLKTANLVGGALATYAIRQFDYLNHKNAPAADDAAAVVKTIDEGIKRIKEGKDYAQYSEIKDSEIKAMELIKQAVETGMKEIEGKGKFADSNLQGIRAVRAILDTRFKAIDMVKAERNFEVPTFKQVIKTLTGYDAEKLSQPGQILNKARKALFVPETKDFAAMHEATAKAALGLGDTQMKEGVLPQVVFAIPAKGEGEQVPFRKLLGEATKGYIAYKANQASERDAKFAEKNAAEVKAEMTTLTGLAAEKKDLVDMAKTEKKLAEKGVWIEKGSGDKTKFQPKDENRAAFLENFQGLLQGDKKAVKFFEENWMSRKAAIAILDGIKAKEEVGAE
jgi:hypothetical protein